MTQQPDFRITPAQDNKTQFTTGSVTITVGAFFVKDGKHQITEPAAAAARLECFGQGYVVENADEAPTIEDWYISDLLPKIQLMQLLLADDTGYDKHIYDVE